MRCLSYLTAYSIYSTFPLLSSILKISLTNVNVNPMLVLRNAVCNRQCHETWATSVAHRRVLRSSRRQADSQQRLASTFWILVFWGVRVYRLSHPPVPVSTSPTAEALAEQPVRRPGAGYSWRKPFLRRPPSTPAVPGEACAK